MAMITKDSDSKLNGYSPRAGATSTVGPNSETSMASFGTAVEKFTQDAGSQIGAAVGEVSERATSYVKSTQTYVEDNPLRSVAYAAAAGLAVGSLLTMALRSRR